MTFPDPTAFGPFLPDRAMRFVPQPIPVAIGRVAELGRLAGVLVVPLQVQRGNTIEFVFRAFREVTHGPGSGCVDPSAPFGRGSSPQVLTGLQGRALVRRAKGHPIEYPLTVDVDQTGAGSSTRGTVRVLADASVTRLLPDHGVWDLELSDGTDSLRKTIVEGPLAPNRGVLL